MSQEEVRTEQDGNSRLLRERIILPVAVILGSLVATEVLVFSLSRVLLATGGATAVVAALGISLGILVASAILAARPRIRSSTLAGLLTIGVLGALGAGAVTAGRAGEVKHEREHEEGAPAASQVTVVAQNVAFDTNEIVIPAKAKVTIRLRNEDQVQHNIAIYTDETQKDEVFRGEDHQPGDDRLHVHRAGRGWVLLPLRRPPSDERARNGFVGGRSPGADGKAPSAEGCLVQRSRSGRLAMSRTHLRDGQREGKRRTGARFAVVSDRPPLRLD